MYIVTTTELAMGWFHPWVHWVGLGWVATWLRDIFNVMKYSTVC